MESSLSPPLPPSNQPSSTSDASPAEEDATFDVDREELMQLYSKIPPRELRSHALALARDRVVGDSVRKVKDDGIFDNFRKTWLKDLETKPQFQNLIRRVEIRCSEFLATLKWTPDLNKATVRERLQSHIEKLSFVDIGVKELLREVNTGVYANPIPFQRFDNALTKIVSDMVYQCIFSSTPEFPTRKMPSGEEPEENYDLYTDESLAPYFVTAEQTASRPSSSLQEQNSAARRRVSLSKSPSIETVDMEISGSESGNEEMRPKSSASLKRESVKRETLTDANDDRVQGALGLLMLASGNDWGDFGAEEKPVVQEDSGAENTESLPIVDSENREEFGQETSAASMEAETKPDIDSSDVEGEQSKLKMENLTESIPVVEENDLAITKATICDEEDSVEESPKSSSQEETPSSGASSSSALDDNIPILHPVVDAVEKVVSAVSEPAKEESSCTKSPAIDEVLSEPDASKLDTVEATPRPTRQRKSNSKYCNDAFVTAPTVLTRGQKRPRGGSLNFYEESSSPSSSVGQAEAAQVGVETGAAGGKKKKKRVN